MALHSISERAGRDRRAGSFDVRDWEVQTASDQVRVGTVRDILVDDADEPRYLDVDLGAFRRRVLLSFRRVAQDPDRAVVWVAGLDKEGFGAIPEYDGDLAKLNADAKAGLLHDDSTAGYPRSAVTGDAAAEEVERIEETRAASPRGNPRLARLGELQSYEVAESDSDVRGWEIIDSDNKLVGRVVELVVDTVAKRVKYLDVELAAPWCTNADESRVLIPIVRADILHGPSALRIDAATAAQLLRGVPAHRGTIDDLYERQVAGAFDDQPVQSGEGRR